MIKPAVLHALDIGSILGGAALVADVATHYVTPIGSALLVLCGLAAYAWRAIAWLRKRGQKG